MMYMHHTVLSRSRVLMSLRRRPSPRRLTAAAVLLGSAMGPFAARAQQPSQASSSAAADRMLGAWQGVLASGVFRERLGFIVSRDSTGALVGLMKSLDQHAQASATVAVRGDTFSFAIAAEHITYSGVLT